MELLTQAEREALWKQALDEGPADNPMRGAVTRFSMEVEELCHERMTIAPSDRKRVQPPQSTQDKASINGVVIDFFTRQLQ